jgi:hypothetical protein
VAATAAACLAAGRADRLVAQPAGEEDAVEGDRREIVPADTKFTGVRVSRYAALIANFSFRQILSSIRSPSLRNPR